MSGYVRKQALLEHIRREISIISRQIDGADKYTKKFREGGKRSLEHIEHEVKSGAFDAPEMEHINAYWAREGLIKHQEAEVQRLRAAAIKLHETLNTYWQGDCEKADVVAAQSKLCDVLSTTMKGDGNDAWDYVSRQA